MLSKNACKKLCSLSAALLLVFFLSADFRAAPGDLDATFGIGGKVVPPYLEFGGDVAVQADGKIVVVGDNAGVLARYNIAGLLDTSFGNDGIAINYFPVVGPASAIAIQADGKIVVAGSACTFGSICDFGIVRYNTDGSPDTSFDGDGSVIVDMGNYDFINDLAIQPDGKIVVVGGSGIAGSRIFSFAAARLNSDGSLDVSFGGDGRVITSLRSFSFADSGGASGVILQPDGKIVAVGSSGGSNSTNDFALVRYNTDGSLDASFDGDGKVITAVSSFGDVATDVAVQADGRIVAAGYAPNLAVLVRYTANGSLDASFDGDGIVRTDIGTYDFFSSVAIQSDGKIVAGGYNSEFVVARYKPEGSLDTTFGGDGIVSTNFDIYGYLGSYGGVSGLAIQPDGKIIVVGSWGADGEYSYSVVARYSGDAAAASNRKLFDFDGDGKSDISVFRPSDGIWYLNQSTYGFSATQFGLSTDKITPADYDGDGKTDIAVFRPSEGIWYLLQSSGGFKTVRFGSNNDIPTAGDFDGDGKSDIAVFRSETGVWYFLYSLDNRTAAFQFGLNGDLPMVGDYDGDAKADVVVFRPANGIWYLQRSSAGFTAVQFGRSTDKLVPGDYDGDGRTDIAVFRPAEGNWYLQNSTAGFGVINFGISEDIPASGDYDGDGKTDVAVFRPSTGVWHLRQSTSGLTTPQFGSTNDTPVPSAFVP